MARQLAKQAVNELLTSGDWAEEKKDIPGVNGSVFTDKRRSLTFDKAGELVAGVSNQELRDAFSETLRAGTVAYRPKDPHDIKRVATYSINEPQDQYVVDISAEYADYLASRALSAGI